MKNVSNPLRRTALRPAVHDAPDSLQSGRVMARAWSTQLDDRQRQPAAWAFIRVAMEAYAERYVSGPQILPAASVAVPHRLDTSAEELARTLGRAAASLSVEEACYQLSSCYTAMLPTALRSDLGAYYTPPALTDHLIGQASAAGVDFASEAVLDPACGGGAFLLPVALAMQKRLDHLSPSALLDHLATHLQGFEIDPFAAWLTQAWLQLAFADELRRAGRNEFPSVVRVCDSLEQVPDRAFDLVIGNPPYGRTTLSPAMRSTYARSLYGHANLYGLFTDLALRWTKPGGVVAFVTPTSFLAGEYFKALRGVLSEEAPPQAIDFVMSRKGVFEDVLQETMLTVYRKAGKRSAGAAVSHLQLTRDSGLVVTKAGRFALPKASGNSPWLMPRMPDDTELVGCLTKMQVRLADWGYRVSTGPLVWNRYKTQLRAREAKDTHPLIWAEAVTADGQFIFRAEKRNHQPYFRIQAGDEWLVTSEPCVLLQRTTAKEQARRLIAAELPAAFLRQHGRVIVENHLNMVRPLPGVTPKVSPAALAAFLNSAVADAAFRCISGSVAVSAFELEALPLPAPEKMQRVDTLLARRASAATIDRYIRSLYFGEDRA